MGESLEWKDSFGLSIRKLDDQQFLAWDVPMSNLELGVPEDLVEFVDLGRGEVVDAGTSTTGHGWTTTSTSSISTSSSVKATSATSTTTSATKAKDLSDDHLEVSEIIEGWKRLTWRGPGLMKAE
jgi:hypothetical protein